MFNLTSGVRAERKLLITVAEWGTSHDIYTLLTSQPSDWSTNFTSYYTKNGSTYTPVSGSTAPTFAANTYYRKTTGPYREILGTRTEDSSIEFNPDIQTSTDIRGVTYTDVNKTEPQQTFDPYYLMGESPLGEYLYEAALANNIQAYNGTFTVYVIAAFDGSAGTYKTVKHTGCSIIPTSMGGDSYVSMPIEVHYSNIITSGTVDKLADDFTFTPTV